MQLELMWDVVMLPILVTEYKLKGLITFLTFVAIEHIITDW